MRLSGVCFALLVAGVFATPDEIIFSVTYRDFLPATCMSSLISTDLFDEYNATWLSPDTFESAGLSGGDACTLPAAWDAWLVEGNISGHPDFETIVGNFENQAQCEAEKFPVNSCIYAEKDDIDIQTGTFAPEHIVRSIIKRELVPATSGIPKPQYCNDTPGSRCGTNDIDNVPDKTCQGNGKNCYTQSNREFFQSWYNDDKKYNKRVGQDLRLQKQPDGKFVFNSTQDVENEEFGGFGSESRTDLGAFFDPLFRFKVADTGFTIDPDAVTSPFHTKVWPQTISSGDSVEKAFWITTEIHSTFQYLADADMTFEFSGDDDFWCFINNRLAIDIGGLHAAVDRGIDLNANDEVRGSTVAEHLGLEDGGIYTIDIYHAERHTTQSNFIVTTTLFQKCNIGLSGTIFLDTSISTDVEEKLSLSSQAAHVGDAVMLLQSGAEFVNTYAFTAEPQNLDAGFIARWRVTIDGSPEGFAFVVQRYGLVDYPFSGGKHLNFKNLPNSFAVAFDLCVDRASGTCNHQRVSLHYPSDPTQGNKNSDSTRIVYDDIFRPLNLDIGQGPETVDIEVRFLETPDHLEVYIDSSLYLRKIDFSLDDILGGTGAHLGLTASSGGVGRTAELNITNWEIELVEFDANKTLPVNLEDPAKQTVVADGTLSRGFSFETRDFCQNLIDAGGLDSFASGVYVLRESERRRLQDNESGVIEAEVVDENNGTYTIALATTIEGDYDVYLTFGRNCSIDVVNGVGVFKGDSCFTAAIPDAVEAVPPSDDDGGIDGDSEGDRTFVYVAAAGGGFIGLAGLIAAFLFVRYRNRWIRDKKMIEKGEKWKLEEQTNFDGKDDYSVVGRMLMATRAAILRGRAQRSKDPMSKKIAEAKNRKDELKEQVNVMKRNNDRKGADTKQGPKAKKPKPKRKEFLNED